MDGANNGERNTVLLMASVLAMVLCMRFLFRSLGRWQRGSLGISVRKKLKAEVFRHLLALPEDFLRSRGVGYFFNRLQNDIGEISLFLSHNGLLIWTESLKLFLAIQGICFLQWKWLLWILPFLLLQGWICFCFRRRQYDLSHEIQECVASERHVMQEYLANHAAIKTHGAGDDAGKRIERGLGNWGKLMYQRLIHENWFMAALQIPIWLCCGSVAVFGLLQVVRKESTLGSVWALIGLLMLMFAPIRTLGTVFVQMQSARSAWHRIRDLLGQDTECAGTVPEQTAENLSGKPCCSLCGDIVFRSLTFSYSESKPLLKNFNMTVPRQNVIFLTGANGCGKSTLFSLLLRLYRPVSGQIEIGGVPIDSYPLELYRSRIGYIGSHPEFIKGTLRDNLLLGNPGHSDEEILDMFRHLQCQKLLEQWQNGLSAMVAERGENFSSGERLRLALIRELLRDTDILLFDEAAANLDQEGRRQFYDMLEKLPISKTVIAIVHEIPENVHWQVFTM